MATSNGDRRILMVLESNFPTEGGGGAEGQLRTICRYLRERGVAVRVFVPMRPDGAQKEHDVVDDTPVWRIPYPKVRKLGGIVLLARMIMALIRERRTYDVIHAHMAYNMAAACCAIGRLLGKTVIVKVTGSLELDKGVLDPRERRPSFVFKRMLFRFATYFQATSREIRDRLVENGISGSRIRVIPNAIDTERFSVIDNRSFHVSNVPLTGIAVGRLSREKAPDLLIESWLEAFSSDDAVRLLLVGGGSMHEELAHAISRAGRDHQIELLGPQEDVERFIARADFAVIPSLYEGLSNSLLEYMAAGLPVIGSRVSGTVDFIDDRCGWLINPGDGQELVQALRTVRSIDRKTLREMGQVARQRVVARARIDSVVAKLAELYQINADRLRPVSQDRAI